MADPRWGSQPPGTGSRAARSTLPPPLPPGGDDRVATTSVRLWVLPPAPEEPRRTRPVTSSSSPGAQVAAAAGAETRRPARSRRGALAPDGDLEGEELVARGQRAELGLPAEVADEDGEVGPRGELVAGHGCLRRAGADVEGKDPDATEGV